MTMQNQNAATMKAHTHYDVYIYHHPANTNGRVHDWERKTSTRNQRRAMLKAKILHRSDKYKKVEVKKREFDSHQDFVKSSTLKVYGSKSRDKGLFLMCAMLAAAACMATLFLAYMS